MRSFLSTLQTLPAGKAREYLMDTRPWTYQIMAQEMLREGKIEPASPAAVIRAGRPLAAAASRAVADPLRHPGDPAALAPPADRLALDLSARALAAFEDAPSDQLEDR
jgi:hypothetical protein